MTQTNETNSRIERLEALMLEIAAANLRHDRDIDQNNTAIARHDEEFSRINVALEQSAARHDEEFSRINIALEQSAARHDEEFSRINAILESNARLIQDLAIQQRETQTEMRSSINDLVSMIGTLGQNADRHWEVIQRHWESVQEMQAEVRGLQTENRRILERLEQHMSNGHGDQ
jgi:chromosome segregation ATPase